jgi:hypothetical protein
MTTPRITPNLRVAQVLRQWPETYGVFRQYGCPDMRRGFFGFMARIMKVGWAARVHKISISDLVESLNSCVGERGGGA